MNTTKQILTKDEIMKFQGIYYKVYNEKITFEEASKLSINLLQLLRSLLIVSKA